MKEGRLRGSYTLEAAIYIPMIMLLLFQSVGIGIEYWQKSRDREVLLELRELDIVQEFYGYQMLEEVREELENGKS